MQLPGLEKIAQIISKQRTARQKRRLKLYTIGFSLLALLGIFSYLTNPFVRFSIIFDPQAQVVTENQQIYLSENESNLQLRNDPFFRGLAKLKSSWHIVSSRFSGGSKAQSGSVESIINEIHQLRFDPQEPYLISGDHFSVLYPRSLGIFYHSILDPRTALNPTDWQNRQIIYLKTLAYSLNVFAQSDQLSTTIVPVGPQSVALMNIYAYPSDTLFSLLYGLQHSIDSKFIRNQYPFESKTTSQLESSTASEKLLQTYRASLQKHFSNYWNKVYDPETGLIKKDLLLSSTKDMAKRQSAFYDNVIAWKTHQLAQELGIIAADNLFLDQYKQRILDTFWLPEDGYFLEDLSSDAINQKWYSSDWLIAYQVGFLKPNQADDQAYLTSSVDYIRRNALDRPFPIQYHADQRPRQLHNLVRWTAADYGSTAIWSNWGMEYIKLLTALAQNTGEKQYLDLAGEYLDIYAYNIKRYRGYPEVYTKNGDFFRTFFYKSIRRTGWVVTYEEARAMHNWTKNSWSRFSR